MSICEARLVKAGTRFPHKLV